MFTGIIQGFGFIDNINNISSIYTIKTDLNLIDCKIGSSICCDGVCLTIISIKKEDSSYLFNLNIGEETLKRSTLNYWNLDSKINLEKSLKVGDEISGHFVYGHVDNLIELSNIKELEKSWEFEFSFSHNSQIIKKYITEKGSIAINGVSLTVANVFSSSFTVSIIPHTYKNTNLSVLRKLDKVNIEFDPLARYIRKIYEK